MNLSKLSTEVISLTLEVGEFIRNEALVFDRQKVGRNADQLKIIFDNNSEFVPYQQIKAELKQIINRYNFDADEMVNNF